MAAQLRKFTINMKSVDQAIGDPIVAGAGDANGRTLRVLFSQEAQDQLACDTKVYLKWKHLQQNVKGYNVFTRVSAGDAFHPTIWEITWPKSMLKEGDVLCHIELVDSVSIACSQNFTVHVLSDPDDGSTWVASDDYSVFQKAIIEMNSTQANMQKQFDQWQDDFEHWRVDMQDVKATANAAFQLATDTKNRLDTIIADGMGLYMDEFE